MKLCSGSVKESDPQNINGKHYNHMIFVHSCLGVIYLTSTSSSFTSHTVTYSETHKKRKFRLLYHLPYKIRSQDADGYPIIVSNELKCRIGLFTPFCWISLQ